MPVRIRMLWQLLTGLYADKRVPGTSKALFWFSLIYLFFPVDIIPDFIPMFGQLDDLTIGPIALYIAWKWIEKKVRAEHIKKWEIVDVPSNINKNQKPESK